MRIRLRVQSGTHQGKEIEMTQDKFLIGRSESCQLRPKSESVSRKHCILAIHDGRLLLQDLKSRNGTYVNDKRLPPDKAKILKAGDSLRIGRLQFEVLIDHGASGAKKPEVKGVDDAAKRTVEGGSSDSRFEEVDVTSWLDEADAIDRVRKMNDPDTRQLSLNERGPGNAGTESDDLSVSEISPGVNEEDSGKASMEIEEKSSRLVPPKKGKPGKIPEHMKAAMKDSSRDAADDALKKFFSGR